MTKRYDPNQPRVPAGHPHGGRWTKDGSGADTSARKAAGLKTDQDDFMEFIDPLDYEYGGIFDENGNMIFKKTSYLPDRIAFTDEEMSKMDGTICVHNHPGHPASFSLSDIFGMAHGNVKKMIVLDQKYIYTMERAGWHERGLNEIWKKYKYLPTPPLLKILQNATQQAVDRVTNLVNNNQIIGHTWDDLRRNPDLLLNLNHYVMVELSSILGWNYTRKER